MDPNGSMAANKLVQDVWKVLNFDRRLWSQVQEHAGEYILLIAQLSARVY